jgi:uncharacterized protein involved in exopolysaccharide biosynthesis
MSRTDARQALRTVEALRRDETALSARVDSLDGQLRADQQGQQEYRRAP